MIYGSRKIKSICRYKEYYRLDVVVRISRSKLFSNPEMIKMHTIKIFEKCAKYSNVSMYEQCMEYIA